jgi:DNA-binding LacI/PurR family transcriptional regulator
MEQDFRTKQYLAEEMAAQLCHTIERDKWPSGRRLPPVRDLAKRFDVSTNTAHAAIRLLAQRGVVDLRPRQRAFVIGKGENPHESRERAGTQARLSHIGLIGVHPSQDQSADDWRVRIRLSLESELAGEENPLYLTRISAADAPDPRQSLLRQLDALAPQLAGAIIFQQRPPLVLELMEHLDRLGLPWVSISHLAEQVGYNYVSADNIAAGRTAGRCFLLNNFEKILFLSPDMSNHVSFTEKAMGLMTAYMHANRFTGGIRYMQCRSVAHGREATLAYLEEEGTPQAVFAVDDRLALGAIQAFGEKGIAVPRQVSVMGSTGLDVAAFASPALTVVAQPMEALGRTAARMLLRMIQTGERRIPGKQLKGELIARDSLSLNEAQRRALMEEGLLEEASKTSPAADVLDK